MGMTGENGCVIPGGCQALPVLGVMSDSDQSLFGLDNAGMVMNRDIGELAGDPRDRHRVTVIVPEHDVHRPVKWRQPVHHEGGTDIAAMQQHLRALLLGEENDSFDISQVIVRIAHDRDLHACTSFRFSDEQILLYQRAILNRIIRDADPTKGEIVSEFRIVLVTASGVEEAERIANLLIGAGLAPCVNIIPSVISVYQWKNKMNRDEEALMIIKSSESSFEELKELVEKNHSYDVPEIISVEISELSQAYAAFLGDFLK
jgi:periplasmic divalent cation tolerance protein